ncbi:hypothetical protein HF669_03240 [Acidithiobacillus thiooxidans]|uniref:pesticin C-terminus-like muramidase n=1 Tax=Acidithiobacillus thiooxidans TaxID=930 RepID=UPI001C069838|nr:pesticin C-terminus-like muramidase [Acidithiobacillus thiooxidans]MBU2810409.1 hypothetical protein [Acidithiobacillus thiooxidans]
MRYGVYKDKQEFFCKYRQHLRGVLLISIFFSQLAHATQYTTSYNCKTAKTETEKAVCQDAQLAKMDRQVSHDYNQLTNRMEKEGNYHQSLNNVTTTQSKWKEETLQCKGDVFCLTDAYGKRLAELNYCYRSDKAIAVAAVADCTPLDRVDYHFIQKSEGMMYDFYVPGAFGTNVETGENLGPRYKKDKITGEKIQKAIGNSGVTVGEGVDLGQQTIEGLRRYMEIEQKKYGKPDDVNIEDMLIRFSPFIGKTRSRAISSINDYYEIQKRYPYLTQSEAEYISNAVRHGYAEEAAVLFNKHSHPNMEFWAMPASVQTVLTDMKFHSYISSVANFFYRADWIGAAKELEKLAVGQYAKYKSRFLARAQMLRDAISYHSLPSQGDPCAPAKSPLAYNENQVLQRILRYLGRA